MTKNSWKTVNKTLADVFEAQELTSEQSENILKALEDKKIRSTISKAFKPRVAKDPNRPKRAMTSYIRWSQEARDGVKAELSKKNPKAKGLELSKAVTKELGKRWEKLAAKEKAKYENAYKEDKKRYDKEMESYTPPTATEAEAAPKSRKGANRGQLSGWTLFGNEHRAEVLEENPDLKNTEVMKILSTRWKEVSDEEKAEYKDRAKKHNEELKENNSAPPAATKTKRAKPAEEKKTAAKAPTSKTTKTAAKPAAKTASTGTAAKAAKTSKAAKAPKFQATPGYNRFAEERRETDETNISGTELQTRWLALSDEERAQYEDDAEVFEAED